MRRKKESVLSFEWSDEGLPKVVRDYRARYRAISQVLDENPEILDLVWEMVHERTLIPGRSSAEFLDLRGVAHVARQEFHQRIDLFVRE